MFPVEYIYADWFGWQAYNQAQRADSESLISLSEQTLVAGSLTEGYCIPQFFLRKNGIDHGKAFDLDDVEEHWRCDLDLMTTNESFVEIDEKTRIPIFTVEHLEDDPKFVKLRLTKEWKEHRPRYKNVSYLHQSYLLPSADHPMHGTESTSFHGKKSKWSYTLHGPVRKLKSNGFTSFERDETDVFRYPTAWPGPAMEWLIRPRPSGWPSVDLIQEIFDSGCHLAPCGRGRRIHEPVEMRKYFQNPELYDGGSTAQASWSVTKHDIKIMDNTEWKTSFSVAENKLGASVSPVQRHVIVLLKIIKKFYFPKVVSTYCLKTIMFWECQNRPREFWKENNSAKCILVMLDRLQECLEANSLPHFFIPRSNLLQYEDPTKLKEAAAIVSDVKRNIFSKTTSLLKRLQSLSYMSHIYLRGVGAQLDNHLLKMQDKNLSEKHHREMLVSLLALFVRKCKEVIKSLIQADPVCEGQNMEKELNICLQVYQSILARNLYKLWFTRSRDDTRNDEQEKVNDFTSFVKEEVKDLSLREDFVALSLHFFRGVRNEGETSIAIPSSRTMKHVKEEQMKIAVRSTEFSLAFIKGTFADLLKVSELKTVVERVFRNLRETHTDGTLITKEIDKLMNQEIAALCKTKMEGKCV